MAEIKLSIIQATDTPQMGAAHQWIEFPPPGAVWLNPRPANLGEDFMVIAWGTEGTSFNDLLARTQQVEAALSTPAAGIGSSWPDVVVMGSTSVLPVQFSGARNEPIMRLVPSVFKMGGGPVGNDIRLNVYWSA